MIRKPKFKIARRLGTGVYEKTQTQKFALSQARKAKSAMRGPRRSPKTEYGLQLLEKQKTRYSYGISARQLARYVKEEVGKHSVSGKEKPVDRLFSRLERRLDNVVYRLGIVSTRAAARQAVSHGHFTLNGRRVTIPSLEVSINDVVGIREGSRAKGLFEHLEKKLKSWRLPNWLQFDITHMEGKITALPENTETFLDLGAVVEFYRRV